jgi:TonB family protein
MTAHLTWFALLTALCLGLPTAINHPSEHEAKPEVIHMIAPSYPAIARNANASGTVAVTIEIDKQGNVVTATVSRGNFLLSAASLDAARKWKFKPNPNQVTNLTVELLFDFVLSDCKRDSAVIDPYHLQISSYESFVASDTEDNVPKELEGTLCKVHHVRLQRDTVEITYGLVGYPQGYLSAEKRLFPNANTQSFGGCVVEAAIDPCSGQEIQTSPKFSTVLYCSACRRAQARWSKANRRAKIVI